MSGITLWVLGRSGHAREVEMIARACQPRGAGWNVFKLIDSEDEYDLMREGGDAVMGVGSPAIKSRVAARLSAGAAISWPILVHPTAFVGPRCLLEAGVVLAPGAIVTVDVSLGAHTMLNTNVTVGHDTTIGRCCQLNPQSAISGNVHIGDGVLIGAGAIVLEGRRIGDRAVIGAGAVVTADVPAGETVIGVPAKPIALSEEQP